MANQETFVVRTCGCHRGMEIFINVMAESRVDAVRLVELIGDISVHKDKVRTFLEGGSRELHVSARGKQILGTDKHPVDSCRTAGGMHHFAMALPISSR